MPPSVVATVGGAAVAAAPSRSPAPVKRPLRVSRRVAEVPEALSIYVNQLVYDLRRRGVDVVTLSLGEAFFDIPLFDFRKLDVERGYHYSDSQGIPELRQPIARYYQRAYGAPVDPDREVLVTAGSKPAIFMVMQAVLDPGDEVLIHEPAWLSYTEQARLVGATSRFIPYDCPVERFHEHLAPRTRLVVINNPNNPAGRVYTARELAAQCRAHGAWVLVDEAYSDFVADDFASMAAVVPDKDGVIVVNSLSKNLGMSGWRVGYMVLPPDLLPHVRKLNQHLVTCAPSILLYYLARYFDDITAITLPQVRDVVEKRRRVADMLDRLRLGRLGGDATFYFFVAIDDFPGSSLDLALSLLVNDGIAVVPGSAYGASTERFVRLFIGTESEERIWQALQILRDRIRDPGFDAAALSDRLDRLGIVPFDAGSP